MVGAKVTLIGAKQRKIDFSYQRKCLHVQNSEDDSFGALKEVLGSLVP